MISPQEVRNLALDFAIHLGLKTKGCPPFSKRFYQDFMKRHPKIILNTQEDKIISKACSKENLNLHYISLKKILNKYELFDRPYLIYNIAVKEITPCYNSLNQDLSKLTEKPKKINSQGNATTMICCGNAAGHHVPPFFIFSGINFQQQWLSSGTTWSGGTVSPSGILTKETFLHYLKEHLLKFIPTPTAEQPILLICDGHTCPVSVSLIEWAMVHYIIIFILPAHTSPVLQPLELSCFKPLETDLTKRQLNLMKCDQTKSLSNVMLCELGSKAYQEAVQARYLPDGFKKAGIFPFRGINDPSGIPAKSSQHPDTHSRTRNKTERVTRTKPQSIEDHCGKY